MPSNWSNPPFHGSLEDAISHAQVVYKDVYKVYGFEVEGLGHHAGEVHVLACSTNTVGFPPAPGEVIECSGLGLGTRWTVRRVAEGWTHLGGANAITITTPPGA